MGAIGGGCCCWPTTFGRSTPITLNKLETVAGQKIDAIVGDDEQRRALVGKTQGTFWSARLLGYSLSDPLAGAEAVVSSRSFYGPLVWSLLVPVVVTALLGRVFCGWICPMNTLLELVDRCRWLLRLAEIRERDVTFSRSNKYVLLAAGLGVVAMSSVPYLATVYPPAILSREMHLWVFGAGVGIGLYLILGICVFELLVSKRWWCRYVCPGGALYSLLGRFRLIRIRRDLDKCVGCGDCVQVCQFDLRPMLVETTGMECTNCGTCISNCDSDALRYSLMLPITLSKNSSKTALGEGEAPAEPKCVTTAAQQELRPPSSEISDAAAVDAVIGKVEEMATAIGIPRRLSEIGVEANQLPGIVKSSRGNSMNGNPRDVSDEELFNILEEML